MYDCRTMGMYTARLRRYLRSEAVWLLAVIVVAACVLAFSRDSHDSVLRTGKEETQRMLFVGDVMLARHVETLMDLHGRYYPFQGLRDLFASHAVVVGNFEGSMPQVHRHTPDLQLRFSVDALVAPVLARVGVTDMTLANNHAYDYGVEGYVHTRTTLTDAGIAAYGSPARVSAQEVGYRTVGGVTIAVVPIHAVGSTPSEESLRELFAEVVAQSDLQIVSIHWGTEYAPTANEAQRQLAHMLVDLGADAIMGHHPHVVQDVELYRNAPIFYSLGNTIFDQYWNDAVQEGLAISVSFADNAVRYELIPLSSSANRSVPAPMGRVARSQFLAALADRSEEELGAALKRGVITTLFPSLASL